MLVIPMRKIRAKNMMKKKKKKMMMMMIKEMKRKMKKMKMKRKMKKMKMKMKMKINAMMKTMRAPTTRTYETRRMTETKMTRMTKRRRRRINMNKKSTKDGSDLTSYKNIRTITTTITMMLKYRIIMKNALASTRLMTVFSSKMVLLTGSEAPGAGFFRSRKACLEPRLSGEICPRLGLMHLRCGTGVLNVT